MRRKAGGRTWQAGRGRRGARSKQTCIHTQAKGYEEEHRAGRVNESGMLFSVGTRKGNGDGGGEARREAARSEAEAERGRPWESRREVAGARSTAMKQSE